MDIEHSVGKAKRDRERELPVFSFRTQKISVT